MKARIALASALIIPAALFLGCASQPAPEPMPPLNPPSHPPVMIEVSCDDFAANQHLSRDVEINLRASIEMKSGPGIFTTNGSRLFRRRWS